MVKKTDASEVIFVLPKNSKAFKTEGHFATLEKERGEKSITFLCLNSEVNKLAKQYKFDVLSTASENAKPKPVRPKSIKQDVASPVAVKFSSDDMDDTEDKLENEKETEPLDDAPYGTEKDESGDPIYDEEEENIEGRAIAISAKTRGMSDVVATNPSKNIRIAQKEKKSVNITARKNKDDDIQSVWNTKWSDNLWSDIPKPNIKNSKIFRKFKLPKKSAYGIGLTAAVALFTFVLVIFLTAGSAKIEITPRPQELNTQLKVAISPNFSSVDKSFNQVPGQLFSISKSASDEFASTAEKDAIQKSRGTITIFNEYGTSPQPLVATTRFELIQEGKASGLVFRTLQSVVVPGMKIENEVVTPGKKDVDVIADKAGQLYNVPAGNFVIVAWREKGDTARYNKIYGKSSESMHGGILGKAKVVSEFDYNNAKEQLSSKVKSEINESLKLQSAGLELFPNFGSKIDSVESTAKADDAADKFTMTISSSIVTVGFKKDDLVSLISQYIEKTSGLMVVPDKLELTYKDIAMDTTNKILRATVFIGGNAYAKIDKEGVVSNLTGKNEAQIKEYLDSVKDIDSAKIELSPFWVKKVPKNKSDIDLSLTF